MSELLIIKNISREGPGLLEDVLQRAGISSEVRDLSGDDTFPDPRAYKALLVLGGPDSANDPTDKMQQELAQIKRALEHGTPCLGICLGLQTLVKAAGGGVVPSKEREIGFMGAAGEQYTVQLTRAGRSDPLFTGLPGTLSVFQLHGETVELTSDMTVLASGKHCQDQIVHIADKAYGIQSHFELTPEMLKIWGREDPDLQSIGLSSLRAGFEDIRESYTHIGTTLLNNFLHIAGLK